jgi:hypothetical protein
MRRQEDPEMALSVTSAVQCSNSPPGKENYPPMTRMMPKSAGRRVSAFSAHPAADFSFPVDGYELPISPSLVSRNTAPDATDARMRHSPQRYRSCFKYQADACPQRGPTNPLTIEVETGSDGRFLRNQTASPSPGLSSGSLPQAHAPLCGRWSQSHCSISQLRSFFREALRNFLRLHRLFFVGVLD